MIWYTALVLAVGVERLIEMAVSTRNARWSFDQGGVEYGKAHFPPMVALHTALLLGCLAEVWIGDRPFIPWLGVPMLVLVFASQGLRWWCISVLGRRWNTRIIIVPGLKLVAKGPYRFLKHPNYVAVIVEGIALPLVYTGWITALVFTILNAILLFRFRIPAENRALASLPGSSGRASRRESMA